ncbi:16S rRNA (guanine(966)-N(2))-methyltransferase RsmD [Bacillus spongiae]|uniref:16S rRNA (Guanine(966)-N(2))-methyltransferase RsmD n=1 Tax=Bacillus spongiae TaxID=2683610 RepID=A0ABU8H9R3_9BACI
MRVISGTCKGRPLKSVPGTNTRPTTDKVKEAIFNMIGPYFTGGIALDLFAGSGGLGIEALSRGMEKVIFVDRDAKAISTIKSNVKSCSFEKECEIYRNEANRALKAISKREITFDYIFLDPPYKKQKLEALLTYIDTNELINESGYVVCEHSNDVLLPQQVDRFQLVRAENYGMISVSIYQLYID